MSETGAGRMGSPLARILVKPRRSTVVLGVIALVSGVAFATVFAFVVTSLTGGHGSPVRTRRSS